MRLVKDFSKRFYEITVIVTLLLVFFLIPFSMIRAQTLNKAGLIIKDGNGNIQKFCIPFDGDTITGYDLLQKSNLAIEAQFSPMGVAVCSINNTGCPADNTCLKCMEPLYWSYWRMSGEKWVYSNLGTGLTSVRNGNIEAWVWGDGQSPPPHISFEEICQSSPPDQNKPTKTRKPTFIPPTSTPRSPTPTKQPSKTATPIPTQTRSPTSTPIPDVKATLPPTAVLLTDTSTPTSTEKIVILPTDPAKIVENIPTLEPENPIEDISAPPKKAAYAARTAMDQYSLESIENPDKDASSGALILDILHLIQNFFASLLP
jgi:hypothetical protein